MLAAGPTAAGFVPLFRASSVFLYVGVHAGTGAPGTYVRGPADVLAAVAVAASEVADLPVLLGRLAELTLGPTDADRVSFFLLNDDRDALELWAVAMSADTGPEGFQEGLSMGPIPVDGLRGPRLRGGAFATGAAAESHPVPPE